MNAKTLEILDQSLRYSLWALLIFFSAALMYVAVRQRTVDNASALRSAFHGLMVSVVLAALFFVFVTFTPLSFIENFAMVRTLEVAPLRLTSLIYERFHEGFSLEGEVWNQTKEPIKGLKAAVRILDADRKLLEEVKVEVTPQPLVPASAGAFSLRYTKNSPFLYGYEVSFLNRDGSTIPHIKGFDVQ